MQKLYKLAPGGAVMKLVDGKYSVSFVSGSGCSEDVAYQEWLAEGNTPDEADAIPVNIKYIPVRTIFERLKAIGKDETVWGVLSPSQQVNFLTLKEGVAENDSEVTVILTAIGLDSETISAILTA